MLRLVILYLTSAFCKQQAMYFSENRIHKNVYVLHLLLIRTRKSFCINLKRVFFPSALQCCTLYEVPCLCRACIYNTYIYLRTVKTCMNVDLVGALLNSGLPAGLDLKKYVCMYNYYVRKVFLYV